MAYLRSFAHTASVIIIAVAGLALTPVSAQNAPATTVTAPSSYADVADFAVDSAAILIVRIRKVREVDAARAPNLPPRLVRLYVEAEVRSAIYGSDPVARRIAYLVDQPRLPNGRAPRINGQTMLLFTRPITVSNQVQLVRPDTQLIWDAAREATARAIAAELARGNVPPAILGVSQAFHVPGNVAGESETQIFLATGTGSPVSLTILRRPNEAPRWAAAFGEIVDESAAIPARRTLGWYRLACGLPATLPAAATADVPSSAMAVTTADYALVVRALGRCDRTPVMASPAPLPPAR